METIDRRKQKTQEAIFTAFFALLAEQQFGHISVEEITAKANVGRSTFYHHFDSKDDLLSAVCKDVFEHVFTTSSYFEHVPQAKNKSETLNHRLAHFFTHFKNNEERIATLFKMEDDYFLRSLQQELQDFLCPQIASAFFKQTNLPENLVNHHIITTFIGLLRWWLHTALAASPEEMTDYYLQLIAGQHYK